VIRTATTLLRASALLLAFSGSLIAQEEPAEPPAEPAKNPSGLAQEELEKRRVALETWLHEPVELQRSAYAVRMDRRDGSFTLRSRRASRGFFSAIHRRGFCSVLLSDGSGVRVDGVADLDSRDTHIRFRALSTGNDIPKIWIEIRDLAPRNGVSIKYEVEEGSEDRVRGMRLIDDGLWVPDADNGAAILPSGLGEWLDSVGEPEMVILGAGTNRPLPVAPLRTVALLRETSPLVVTWSDPRTQVTLHRREEPDEKFPGKKGLFLRADVFGPEGQIELIVPVDARMGPFEVSQALRELTVTGIEPQSLRRKTGDVPKLRSFLSSPIVKLTMIDPPEFPRRDGEVRHRFADLGKISEHWKKTLGIDDAFFVVDRWLDREPGPTTAPWKAARECGGDAELREASKKIEESGHFLGVGLDLRNLTNRSTESPPRPEDWSDARRFLEEHDALDSLRSLTGASLLIVRQSDPNAVAEALTGQAFEDKQAVANLARESIGLWAHSPFRMDDLQSSVLFERALDSKIEAPTRTRVFPLYPACYSDLIRFSSTSNAALGPNDAAGFLVHLLLGQLPNYEIPKGVYFESDDVSLGEGPEWCFARDDGWTSAKGLSTRDRFIRNTHQVANILARQSVRQRLTQHKILTDDGTVQETYFGPDLRVVVNFGEEEYEDEPSQTILPQYGFAIRHPFFVCFHAKRAGGMTYDEPAFYTVESLEGKMYLRADQVLIYRGFGPKKIRLGGKEFEVERELRTRIW